MKALIIALIPLVPGVAQGQSYRFTEFDLPGGTATYATAINNAGQVLGFYSDSNGYHCFLRNTDASFTTIDPPGANPSCNGLNNRGEIVGTTDGGLRGFIRSVSGQFTMFEVPASGPGANVAAINDLGEIVGTLAGPPDGGIGFLRSPEGVLTKLTAPIGEIDPATINNRGEIAGWVLNGSSQGTQHGFLRSADGVYRRFDLPGTTSYTRITALNNIGQFAGYIVSGGGFVSNSDGSFTDLESYPVTGLNDSGQIVGSHSDAKGRHGFIGTPAPGPAEPRIRSVLTPAAFGGSPSIARGTWIEVYGQKLAPGTREWRTSDFSSGIAPTSLDSVSVLIGGVPAFISYISPGQVNALVPSNVAVGTALVTITNGILTSAPWTVTVKESQPALLSLPPDFDPQGAYVAALFPDFMTYALPPFPLFGNVPTRRPKPGDMVILFGTGFGPVTREVAVGQVVTEPAAVMASIQITFSRATAPVPGKITYAGLVVGTVGLYQFNVVLPDVPLLDGETSDDYINVYFTANGVSALGRNRLFFSMTK